MVANAVETLNADLSLSFSANTAVNDDKDLPKATVVTLEPPAAFRRRLETEMIRSRPRLLKYLRAKAPVDAEDILQDVFVNLLSRRWQCYPDNLEAYIFMAVVNGHKSYLRKRQYNADFERQVDSRVLDDCERGLDKQGNCSNPEAMLEADQSLRHMIIAVASLPERCRAVFVLRYFYLHKNQQIAHSFQITTKAVENNLVRARKKLTAMGVSLWPPFSRNGKTINVQIERKRSS